MCYAEIVETDLIRLESEFHTASTFALDSPYTGEEIIDFVQYGTSKELNEDKEGYPILRLNEFDSFFISEPSKYCSIIDKETYQSLQLKKDDVLICRTNGNYRYVGKSAIVPDDYNYAYASYLFKIRPKRELINSSTLVSYLNSKYGRIEIEKYSMASNQVNFSPAKFRQLRVPSFGLELNGNIEESVYNSFEILKKSQNLYSQAESLLLRDIGLENFTPNNEGINIKSFSNSFAYTGRLDAEYYQPKYEFIENAVKNYYNGYNTLDFYIENYSTGYPFKSKSYIQEGGIPLIRINNINKGSLDISNAAQIPLEDADLSPKDVATENDILISMSGTIGNTCRIPDGVKALINQRIMRITPKNYNNQVLPLVINSIIGEYQLNRIGTGAVQTNISPTDIKDILIPHINEKVQSDIASLIEESFRLKKQSEQLLETAKRAVELAIEENEKVAIDFINSEVDS